MISLQVHSLSVPEISHGDFTATQLKLSSDFDRAQRAFDEAVDHWLVERTGANREKGCAIHGRMKRARRAQEAFGGIALPALPPLPWRDV